MSRILRKCFIIIKLNLSYIIVLENIFVTNLDFYFHALLKNILLNLNISQKKLIPVMILKTSEYNIIHTR